MIGIKDAVSKAKDFVAHLYDDDSVKGLQLEEVQRTEDSKYWLITVGFWRDLSPTKTQMEMLLYNPRFERDYKIIKVDAETGEPIAMQMREV